MVARIERATWVERFMEYVLIGDDCWPWIGARQQQGYGLWTFYPPNVPEKRLQVAHRVMWELLRGPIPAQFTDVDHLCRNKGCVNPDHLEPVTHEVNLARAGGFCKKGHRMETTRRTNPCGRSFCGVCYDDRLARDRAARLARGHKKPGRKPKAVRSSDHLLP